MNDSAISAFAWLRNSMKKDSIVVATIVECIRNIMQLPRKNEWTNANCARIRKCKKKQGQGTKRREMAEGWQPVQEISGRGEAEYDCQRCQEWLSKRRIHDELSLEHVRKGISKPLKTQGLDGQAK